MTAIHEDPHPLAGETATIEVGDPEQDLDNLHQAECRVEDWWDRVSGGSWRNAHGNPAAIKYGMRAGFHDLPSDDEVVYVKVGGIGHLIHDSELVHPNSEGTDE